MSETKHTAQGSDICECGEYYSQHEAGGGPCRICRNSRAPYDGCVKFRFSRHATPLDLEHWNAYHSENWTRKAKGVIPSEGR